MEKILNQEEIDALFRAAQGGQKKAKGKEETRKISPCNFRQAGQISKEQVRAVSMLHDTFARNLTHSLGAYLRVLFEVNVVSVEQISYAEFLQRVPEVTYLASVHLQLMDAMAAMQLDLPLAFPIIDLLLGGVGKGETQVRDITEIEEEILESVVKILCRELQVTWEPLLQVGFEFAQRQQQTQILRLMAPNEKVLSLSFEIRMPETRGMLNLVFPAVVSNALLRKLSQEWSFQKKRGGTEVSDYLRERLLSCPYQVELTLPPTMVGGRDLLNLETGQVLVLRHKAEDAGYLSVAGRKLFSAHPVRSGRLRGAQIQQRLDITVEYERERK